MYVSTEIVMEVCNVVKDTSRYTFSHSNAVQSIMYGGRGHTAVTVSPFVFICFYLHMHICVI